MVDLVSLNPMELYRKYNIRPVRLIVTVLLVILTTLQALNMGRFYNAYERSQISQFYLQLLGKDDYNPVIF